MTGQPPNIQITAERRAVPTRVEKELTRRNQMPMDWRLAELAVYVPGNSENHRHLLRAKKAADHALRQLADSLLKRGHP